MPYHLEISAFLEKKKKEEIIVSCMLVHFILLNFSAGCKRLRF